MTAIGPTIPWEQHAYTHLLTYHAFYMNMCPSYLFQCRWTLISLHDQRWKKCKKRQHECTSTRLFVAVLVTVQQSKPTSHANLSMYCQRWPCCNVIWLQYQTNDLYYCSEGHTHTHTHTRSQTRTLTLTDNNINHGTLVI